MNGMSVATDLELWALVLVTLTVLVLVALLLVRAVRRVGRR